MFADTGGLPQGSFAMSPYGHMFLDAKRLANGVNNSPASDALTQNMPGHLRSFSHPNFPSPKFDNSSEASFPPQNMSTANWMNAEFLRNAALGDICDGSDAFDDSYLDGALGLGQDDGEMSATNNSSTEGQEQTTNRQGAQKRTRMRQACHNCRQKKSKCDGIPPGTCSTCRSSGVPCTYPNVTKESLTKGTMRKVDLVLGMLQGIQMQMNTLEYQVVQLSGSQRPGSVSSGSSTHGERGEYQHHYPVPPKHNASAHKLPLTWESISHYFKDLASERYVIENEGNRSGLNSPSSLNQDAPDTPARQIRRPTTCDGVQTSVLGSTGSAGALNLDATRSRRLFDNYLRSVHSILPFLDTKHIMGLIESLEGRSHQAEAPTVQSSPIKPSQGVPLTLQFNRKRRRSEAQDSPFGWNPCGPGARPVDTAVLLLVLALGELTDSQDSPFLRNVDHASGLLSTSEGSQSFTASQRKTNLVYFKRAKAILSNLHGRGDLTHVHGFILAGLFMAQMVQPREAWWWIHSACVEMNLIVKDIYCHSDESSDRLFSDQVQLTYWTCISLESEMLGEMDHLPQSGLSEYLDKMPFPKGPLDSEEVYRVGLNMNEVMYYFSQQLHLQLLLNWTYCKLYVSPKRQPVKPTFSVQHLVEALNSWRSSVPAWMQWSDSDANSTDMKAALMRSKAYFIAYAVNRPYLQEAIERAERMEGVQWSPASFVTHRTEPSENDGHMPTTNHVTGIELSEKGSMLGLAQSTMLGAQRCVEAALKTIDACNNIHNMLGKVIVPSLFSTVQSQFGAVLVLAAAYTSKNLSWLVPAKSIEYAIESTLRLMQELAPLSGIMHVQLLVLQRVHSAVHQAGSALSAQHSADAMSHM